MPTGYTADIAKGITFQQFAMSCARAFGACVYIRDEPADAPIPDEFKPCTYDAKRKIEEQERLNKLRSMTAEECEQAAARDYADSIQHLQEVIQSQRELRAKYEAMLKDVDAWAIPSQDHAELKTFMRKQILDSIEFDCDEAYHEEQLRSATKQCGEAWRAWQEADILHSIEYHDREQAEENYRARKRTEWIRQLRQSLTSQKPK